MAKDAYEYASYAYEYASWAYEYASYAYEYASYAYEYASYAYEYASYAYKYASYAYEYASYAYGVVVQRRTRPLCACGRAHAKTLARSQTLTSKFLMSSPAVPTCHRPCTRPHE